MTPEEKIEALRKLFDNIDGNIEELKQGAWWDGFYWTRQKVLDIIDPPKPKWRQMVDQSQSDRAWELCPICRPDSLIEAQRERITYLEAKLAGFDTAY